MNATLKPRAAGLERHHHFAPGATRSRLALAVLLACMATIVASATMASSASAYANGLQCNNFASGDICWINYYTAYQIAYSETTTQYGRDQVCAKARNGITTGPVASGSGCARGTNLGVYYTYPGDQKKAYGYWAGNGDPIVIGVYGRT